MRISDWSSDVCSSDLLPAWFFEQQHLFPRFHAVDWAAAERVARVEYGARAASGLTLLLTHSFQAKLKAGFTRAVFGFAWHARVLGVHVSIPPSKLGRASCRERGGQYVSIWVVAGSL